MATPYLDGPIYYLTCPSGHQERVLLGNPKYEVLFQMGSYALLDENYWAAIAMFGSSLEEFWEFALQCIYAFDNVTPLPVPRVNRLGNRQRFLKAWHKVFTPQPTGSRPDPKPPVLTDEQLEIRHKVMHRGHIPTKEEAFELGNLVLTRVAPAIEALRWKVNGAVGTALAAIIAEATARLKLGEPTAAMQDAMILHEAETQPQKQLEDYLSHLRKLDALFEDLQAASKA